METNRTKNVIRNTKWGIIQQFVNVFFPFVVRSVLIHILGADYAGLSSLFTSILTVLSLSELGFSNAIIFSMYKPVAEDDKEKIRALLNTYKKTYKIIGTVIMFTGVIIIPFLPLFIDGDVPADISIYYIYLIYLFNTVISYFLFAYKTSILSAYQRQDVISKNTLITNIGLYSMQCLMVYLYRNYYVFLVVLPITTILLNIFNNRAANKMFPDLFAEGQIDLEDKRELKKNVIGLMIWKIGGTTRNTLDSIVVSSFLGLTFVTMYTNYFLILNGINAFMVVLSTSMNSGIGNKIVRESPERNYEDFTKFQFYYMWIAGWCTVTMMCLYQPFMKLWMGEKLMFPDHIMFLFCYYFWMLKQGDINSVYYQAAGLWWRGKWRSVVEASLNLVLNIMLGYIFGIIGILFATIISYTCVYFYGCKFVFTDYFKNGKLKKFYFDNLGYGLCTAVTAALSYSLVRLLFTGLDNKIQIVVITFFCLIFPNAIFASIFLVKKRNRQYIKDIFLRIKRTQKNH